MAYYQWMEKLRSEDSYWEIVTGSKRVLERVKKIAGMNVFPYDAIHNCIDVRTALEDTPELLDSAMSVTKGGIDLNDNYLQLNIRRDGNGVPLPIEMQDPAMSNIRGLTPVILEISPLGPGLLSEISSSVSPT